MKTSCLLPLAVTLLFASCSAPSGMRIRQYESLTQTQGKTGPPLGDLQLRIETPGKPATLLQAGSENEVEMPKLAAYTTLVYVAVQPGKPCKFEISSAVKGSKAVVEIGTKR